MKRRDLERWLEEQGYRFLRDAKHCVWSNGVISIPIPHHSELNRFLAKKIMKQAMNGVQLKAA